MKLRAWFAVSACPVFMAAMLALSPKPVPSQGQVIAPRSWIASADGQVRSSLARLPEVTQPQALQAYGKLPLSFEANQGQADPRAKFISRGSGYSLFLTGTEAVLALTRPGVSRARHRLELASTTAGQEERQATAPAVLRMKLLGANPAPHVSGLEELPGKSNYFIGNDPKKWRTNVANYAKVEYKEIYPGVDLVYHGNQRQLEHDFILAPGANPSGITMELKGADKLSIDSQGDLVLATGGGEVRLQKPVVYQEVDGARREIAGSYVLKGSHRVGFQLGAYDASRRLVIDPVLSYSTYLGGSGVDIGFGIAVDSSGNAYVTGVTVSTNFPTTTGAFRTTLGGGFSPAFVTKLNPTGSALVYSTYLGGSGGDLGVGIAVDSSGNAYVTGDTGSTNFPTTNPFQATNGGGADAFLAKINPKGPTDLINDLVSLVQSFNLTQGISNSLDAKLATAVAALNAMHAGDITTACNLLSAFINDVQAQSGIALTTAQATQLIALANQIKAALGCP